MGPTVYADGTEQQFTVSRELVVHINILPLFGVSCSLGGDVK